MRIFNKKPFLIAEIGVNYYDIAIKEDLSPFDAAKLMIKEAQKVGIDAVKFQSYKAETLASKNSPAYWDLEEESTTSQYELFKKFDSFSYDDYKALASYCNELGIVFLSTPFDYESIDYLNELMDYYKISSSDLTNIPFIEKIATKDKPILLSTGASTLKEIKLAVDTIENISNCKIGLLHCVLSYPTSYEDANLLMIKDLKENFPQCDIGYSDHTKPDDEMLVLSTAYLYGANIIEKHFTLDKSLKGNDHYHAMDPEDVLKFNKNIEFLNKINGLKNKQPIIAEAKSRKEARRSIVAIRDIDEGEVISKDMLIFKRPGTGISPSNLNDVIDKIAKRKIEEDELLNFEMFN
ncbi:N-acetylneuraminate synthase family protein [Methanobrevibacter sp. DSM 116169]|uniref:N-acetylneuraminate synthase family protein n=1 Tax=Methanobrevibacter sp. DSM 116169 TaxID=3242727 RepID=UPI0038FCAB4D